MSIRKVRFYPNKVYILNYHHYVCLCLLLVVQTTIPVAMATVVIMEVKETYVF